MRSAEFNEDVNKPIPDSPLPRRKHQAEQVGSRGAVGGARVDDDDVCPLERSRQHSPAHLW